jgi:hypothetical protein
MPHLSLRRATCTLLLAMSLLPAAAASASSRAATTAARSARATAARGTTIGWWQHLVRLLAPAGCGLDPHGLCAPSPGGTAPAAPTVSVDEGCALDPHGLCSLSH